jgi:hypothetical protein
MLCWSRGAPVAQKAVVKPFSGQLFCLLFHMLRVKIPLL